MPLLTAEQVERAKGLIQQAKFGGNTERSSLELLKEIVGDCTTTFYIVFMNDSPEFVSTDEEVAKQELAKLKEEYFAKNKGSFQNREEYNNICYWHIHDVRGSL